MQIENVTLEKILFGQQQHVIPVFQRAYSWTMKNWSELWSDIKDLVREGDNSYHHFLGPIIIDRGDTGTYVPARLLVIDGQQRLVTLSLLQCALRDLASKHDLKQFVSNVNDLLTFTTTDERTERRLLPRSADKTALEKVIESSVSSKDNRQQIVKAYRFFARELKKGLPVEQQEIFEYLNEIYNVTIARLKFVSITLDATDDPTKIYESMNFKGKPLLVADLIRNYVLMQLTNSDTQDEFFIDEWEPFESVFADNSSGQPDAEMLEDFHYRFLIAKRGYFAKRLVYAMYKKQLRKDVKQSELDDVKLPSLKALVESQSRYAKYYRRIMHPQEYEDDKELEDAFSRFGFLDARTATPFLMSLYERYQDEQTPDHITKSEFLEMMNGVESFIIRRSIMRLRTRGYGLDFAQAISNSENLEKLCDHFDDKGWPSDSAIEATLVEFPLYLRERKKARLILEQLEISFGHKEQVDLSDPDKIQIEHILPQKRELSPEWKEMLGEDAYEIHEGFRDTLGNLTLTGYNQELGAKSFHEKKMEYARHGTGSHLELNTFVLDQNQWTEKEIKERAEELIKKIIRIWPRPDTPKRDES